MADDVVHLAGDPGAFGGGGEAGLLVAFALQAVGAVDEGLRVILARTHQDARQGGDDEHPDVREHQSAPVVREPPRGDHEGCGEQCAGPGQGAHREPYRDVEDHDLLQQRRLDDRARPHVDEGERRHEGQYEQGVAAAPQQRSGERDAHREDQRLRHLPVDGDRAPAAGGDVEDGEEHPERGEGAVPDGRAAAVEGADVLEEALYVAGERGGRGCGLPVPRVRERGGGVRPAALGECVCPEHAVDGTGLVRSGRRTVGGSPGAGSTGVRRGECVCAGAGERVRIGSWTT